MDAFLFLVAIPDQTATTICQQLTDHLITLHSCPRTMVTDNGPSLVGNVMNDFCRLYAIKHITITPYNPPANGLVERQNSTIAAMLSAYCSDDASSWDLHLSKVLFAYNTSIHRSTNQSPFFVLYGRDATLPSDLALRIQPRQLFADCSIYIQEQATRLRSAWNAARSAIESAQHRQKNFADTFRRAEEHKFNMHQLVLVYEDQPPKQRDHKLRQKYIGPLRIIGIRRPNLIVTDLDTTTPRTRTVLMNRAKPFIGPAVLPFRRSELTLRNKHDVSGNNKENPDDDDSDDTDVRPPGILIFENTSYRQHQDADAIQPQPLRQRHPADHHIELEADSDSENGDDNNDNDDDNNDNDGIIDDNDPPYRPPTPPRHLRHQRQQQHAVPLRHSARLAARPRVHFNVPDEDDL